MHLERTLDEAYFPGLTTDELAVRNEDQIVSSKFRDDPDCPAENVPLLIVPQLWLWRVGNVIVSAHTTTRESGNLRHLVWRDDELGTGRLVPVVHQMNADVQLGLIMADFIDAFGREKVLDDETKIPPALDLFESRVVSLLSEVKMYMRDTKRNAIDYDTEERFHHVLADCRSELAMIQNVLDQQEEIMGNLIAECGQPQPGTGQVPLAASFTTARQGALPNLTEPDLTPLMKAQVTLLRYRKRIQKIDGDAERIEKNVQDLLNLKRTYASVQDSHASVLLSVAAIGFAIVTIIFAPMAFLTALFALDIQGFDRLRMQDTTSDDSGVVSDVANNHDITINVVTKDDPVYNSGRLASVFGKWPTLLIHEANML